MSSKKQKIIKITTEGLKNNYIENYSDTASNWSPEIFSKLTNIEIKSKTKEELVFDITGVDATIVNTLRRIMIAEIPTMAIETVIINQNTSIIPDEVLAHRLGLIPILADANDFEEKKEDDDFTEKNCLKFKLNVKCEKVGNKIINEQIFSKDLIFEPIGNQKNKFYDEKNKKYNVGLVHDDIYLNKLTPGMEIDLICYCVKGIGRVHAKWSPVCTAYYKLINKINFLKEISGNDAQELKQLCPKGVFIVNKKGNAEVGNIRECTSCRECIRQEKFKDSIELGKIADHYEFHIESVGMYTPESIFFRAIDVLKNKIKIWRELLKEKSKNKK